MTESGNKSRRIIIVGAGLAGALMACFLGKAGHHVEVYERRGDPRKKGFIGGRSIKMLNRRSDMAWSGDPRVDGGES